MNDFRIARNDDAPYHAGEDWISDRTRELVIDRLQDQGRVFSAVMDAIAADDDAEFADNLARFFCHMEGAAGDMLEDVSFSLRDFILNKIEPMIEAEADTDAELEWDSRQTGAPE